MVTGVSVGVVPPGVVVGAGEGVVGVGEGVVGWTGLLKRYKGGKKSPKPPETASQGAWSDENQMGQRLNITLRWRHNLAKRVQRGR